MLPSDFSEDRLQELREALHADGFLCYETAVGGAGYGFITLPSSHSSQLLHVEAEGGAEEEMVPIKTQFENTPAQGLESWANQVGKWTFA